MKPLVWEADDLPSITQLAQRSRRTHAGLLAGSAPRLPPSNKPWLELNGKVVSHLLSCFGEDMSASLQVLLQGLLQQASP